MASLRTQPGSSTPKQRQVLHQLKRRLGLSNDQLHDAIGANSTTMLSSVQASECIQRLGGGDLPNPPGKKPPPYEGKRKTTNATRMIAPDHIEQIERMMGVYFENDSAGIVWLNKNFDVDHPRGLLTAQRAGQVIFVLKGMIDRRNNNVASEQLEHELV